MNANNHDVPKNSPGNRQNIAPKARSLRVHGLFVKSATKLGIVAIKASFLIRRYLLYSP